MSDVSEWLSFWARSTPGTAAIIDGPRTLTYAELEHRVAGLAGGFLHEGIAPGEAVGMLARNAAEFFVVVMACARIGVTFVPLNDRLTTSELRFLVADSDLAAIVTDAHFLPAVEGVSDLFADHRVFSVDDAARPLCRVAGEPVGQGALPSRQDAPLFICYTSGTTGSPKGAVLTHTNVIAIANSVQTCDDLTSHDVALLPVPLAFTGSCVSVGMPLLHAGATLVIDSSVEPEQVLSQIAKHGVTFMSVVPLVYQRMLEHGSFAPEDVATLRVAKSGGAPVPEALIRAIQSHKIRLIQAYGITEGGGYNLALPSRLALDKPGSTGMPVMHELAAVADERGRHVPPGTAGELLLKGPMISPGYLNRPEATAATIRDGWLHTGDVVVMDEDGCFRVIDRKKDMLISGGINIYPADIERVLAGHSAVQEVAVVGTAHPTWGEVPWAFIVSSDPELTVGDLNGFCDGRLGTHTRLAGLTLLTALPRGMSGKVLKRELSPLIGTAPSPPRSP